MYDFIDMSSDDIDEIQKENERLKAELERANSSQAKLNPQYVACWWVWSIGATLWLLAFLHLVPKIVGWIGFLLGGASTLYSVYLSRKKPKE